MKRIFEIAKLEKRLVVGLMSGTSADGVDAALVEIEGHYLDTRVHLIKFCTVPYPDDVAEKVRTLQSGTTRDVCEINFQIGELFAEAALKVIRDAGKEPEAVHLIGSHGQTVYHIADADPARRSTLQIGEPSVIAERTGIVTIADFRVRDVAAGGFGAPLIPYADYLLFRDSRNVRALQNIGGIANVTVVTPEMQDMFAFDTGPGNILLDECVRLITGAERQFDEDGSLARSGKVDHEILRNLLEHPYLSIPPPKTTGREMFGGDLVLRLFADVPREHQADMLATLTAFTAHSIKLSYDRFVFPKQDVNEVVLSGGGSQNGYLVESIRALFDPIPVRKSDEFGIPADAKEAIGFAILANETLNGNPSNVPSATGASHAVVLGKIVP